MGCRGGGVMLSEWDRIEDDWHAYQGLAKEHWPRIDRSTLALTGGRRDALIEAVERTYDISREQARREVTWWLSAAPRLRRERADVRRVPTGNRWSGQRRPRVDPGGSGRGQGGEQTSPGWLGGDWLQGLGGPVADYGGAALAQARRHPAATLLLAVGIGMLTARLVASGRR